MRIDELFTRLSDGIKRRLTEDEARLAALSGRLHALSPLQVLSRGYAIASAAGGEVVSSVEQAQKGDKLSLRLLDGQIACLSNGQNVFRNRRNREMAKKATTFEAAVTGWTKLSNSWKRGENRWIPP